MTRRAICIGLLASALVAGVGFFNDMVMKQTFLFSSYMPACVYGLLILFVLFGNPLLARLRRSWALSPGELATIIVLSFPACFVSGRTLVHHFPGTIITPKHYNKTQLGWQRYDLLRRVPSLMLAGYRPDIRPADVRRPAVLRARLLAASGDDAAGQLSAAVATRLPDADATPEALARLLNDAIHQPDLFDSLRLAPDAVPAAARRMLETGFMNPGEQVACNRILADAAFPEALRNWLDRDDAMVNGFQRGLDQGLGHISPRAVPWDAWRRTLLVFWIPLLLALCLAYIGFALAVQRQWVDNEHLPFPIVQFTESVMPDRNSPANRTLFRQRAFWICTGAVAFLHLNNYGVLWWPDYGIEIPRYFNLSALRVLIPVTWDSWRLLDPIIYFTVVGMAYFISSEASLSVGLAPYAYAIIAGVLSGYGIILGGAGWNSIRPTNFVMLGGYFGLFLMLLYYGRRHLLGVFRRCVGLASVDEVAPHEYWGARTFLVAAFAYVAILHAVGIQWLWGVWYFVLLFVVYSVVARIVAETGMILIHPVLFPGILATGLVGERLVGLDQVVPMVIVSTVIGVGCHVVMLPLMSQGLRLLKGQEAKAARWATVSLVVALAVAVPVTIYLQYDYGAANNNDGWTRWLPHSGLEAAERVARKLDAQGFLEDGGGEQAASLGRPPLGRPALVAFGIAVSGVLAFEFMRLRFRWWPFHPIVFVVLDFWISRQLAVSFLIGWLIKALVCKYGGTRWYQAFKPAMLGLIAGDMLGQIVITIICTIYSLSTGTPPKAYWVLPG